MALASLGTSGPALADFSIVSHEYRSSGTARLVDPGFADLESSYDGGELGRVVLLQHQPGFSSDDNWLVQDIRLEIDTDTVASGHLYLFSNMSGNLVQSAAADDLDSTMWARVGLLVTETHRFDYRLASLGHGDTGVNERAARLVVTPSGGAPILDTAIHATGGMTASTGSYQALMLTPGLYDISMQIDLHLHETGPASGDGNASITFRWYGVPGPGTTGTLALAGLLLARRRRNTSCVMPCLHCCHRNKDRCRINYIRARMA